MADWPRHSPQLAGVAWAFESSHAARKARTPSVTGCPAASKVTTSRVGSSASVSGAVRTWPRCSKVTSIRSPGVWPCEDGANVLGPGDRASIEGEDAVAAVDAGIVDRRADRGRDETKHRPVLGLEADGPEPRGPRIGLSHDEAGARRSAS